MADIINTTYQIAQRWQEHVLWIRVNIGYMTAEEETLRKEGDDTTQIQQILKDFVDRLDEFLAAETDIFTLARTVEAVVFKETIISMTQRQRMCERLEQMKWTFRPWFLSLNEVIEERMIVGHDSGMSLLMCCGTEMLRAHTAYREKVDELIEVIIPPVPDTYACPCWGPVPPEDHENPWAYIERVRFIYDSSHLHFAICRCKRCGQIFLEEFNEDTPIDDMWTQWIPLTLEESAEMDRLYPQEVEDWNSFDSAPVVIICISIRKRLILGPHGPWYWSNIKPLGFHC